MIQRLIVLTLALVLCPLGRVSAQDSPAGPLEVHRIFGSHMVLQRDKPITIWGWTTPGDVVTVTLDQETIDATAGAEAYEGKGRWEAKFPPRETSSEPITITVTGSGDTFTFEDVLIGDVWVMNGQSNMAFGLSKTLERDMASAQANLPLLRRFGIKTNEQQDLQVQIAETAVMPWTVATPDSVGGFSAIGYAFASRVQRATGIPIGFIDTARGGASIESLVPERKFADDPLTASYAEHIDRLVTEFDAEAKRERVYQNTLNRMKNKGVPEDKWPTKESITLRSWDIPGQSPSHKGSCYNGMFGVFKGIHIKGVLFHQGYNNAMGGNCKPEFYRVMMRLMVEGWREDFENPELAVGVIGFCAGSIPQSDENFEIWSDSNGAFIREAQRLGLDDAGGSQHTAYMPGHDIQIPGLHPHKKEEHGSRAARWALAETYGMKIKWNEAKLLSSEATDDVMVLTFDQPVMPHDRRIELEGFSIADASGKFYKAFARSPITRDADIWATAGKTTDAKTIHVWSPLVEKPVAVRYAWSTSPQGNLYVDGMPWAPLFNFRTDEWDLPESHDWDNPPPRDRAAEKAAAEERAQRNKHRRLVEGQNAELIIRRLDTGLAPLPDEAATNAE